MQEFQLSVSVAYAVGADLVRPSPPVGVSLFAQLDREEQWAGISHTPIRIDFIDRRSLARYVPLGLFICSGRGCRCRCQSLPRSLTLALNLFLCLWMCACV